MEEANKGEFEKGGYISPLSVSSEHAEASYYSLVHGAGTRIYDDPDCNSQSCLYELHRSKYTLAAGCLSENDSHVWTWGPYIHIVI